MLVVKQQTFVYCSFHRIAARNHYETPDDSIFLFQHYAAWLFSRYTCSVYQAREDICLMIYAESDITGSLTALLVPNLQYPQHWNIHCLNLALDTHVNVHVEVVSEP